jgi:hypothetical protein
MARARQIHAEILAEKPGAHRSHYALGLIEQKVGNLSAAEAAIREALRIAPKITAYKKRLVSIQQQSGEVKVKSQPIAPKLTAAKPKVKSDEMAQGTASKRTTAPKPPTKRTPNKQETAKRQVGL